MAWTRKPVTHGADTFNAKNGTGSDIAANQLVRINQLSLSAPSAVPNGWDGAFEFGFTGKIWLYRDTTQIGVAYNMGQPVYLNTGSGAIFVGYALPKAVDAASGADWPALAAGTQVIATTDKVVYVLEGQQDGLMGSTSTSLAAAATTFVATKAPLQRVSAASGNETVTTITGGHAGQILTLKFDGSNTVTINDTAADTADTVNLSAAFTSADNTILKLVHDGTKWFEVSRSANA